MSDARRYAVWPEPRSRSRSLKGSRPSVPHGTNFLYCNPSDNDVIQETDDSL